MYCCFVEETNEHRMRIFVKPVNIGKIGKGGAAMKSKSHDEAMAELYTKDPELALQVLNSILEDGDQ